jgi:hypothetical protein
MGFYRYIFILIILFLASCIGVIDKPDKKNIIRKKDFVPIFTEIQLANGLVSDPAVQDWIPIIDSLTTYYYIAEKYGYTKEAVDKTLRYYFLKNPKRLISIYEKMLVKLSEMEDTFDKQLKIEAEIKANVWPNEKNYYYPLSDGSTDFEITIPSNEIYLLKFTATLFPDDQSVNAKASMFTVRADSVLTGNRTFFEAPKYIKDGRPHNYEIEIANNQNRNVILKGSLYDITNNINNKEWQRHISIENIVLKRLVYNL